MLSRVLTVSRFLAHLGVAGTVMSQISWKATDLLHSLLTPSQPHFTEPNLNSLLLSFFPFPFPARSMENVFHDMLFLTYNTISEKRRSSQSFPFSLADFSDSFGIVKIQRIKASSTLLITSSTSNHFWWDDRRMEEQLCS